MLRRSESTTTSAWTSSAAAISKMVRSAAPLPPDPVDLRVRERDPRQLVGGPHEQDPLDVVRRLGLDHDPLGPVGRARVRVHDDRSKVGEVLDEAGLCRSHDIADRRRVLEARDADHDVRPFEAGDLFSDGRRQHGLRHRAHRTTDAPTAPIRGIVPAYDPRVATAGADRRGSTARASRRADDIGPRPASPVAWSLYDFANTIFSFAVVSSAIGLWLVDDAASASATATSS